MNCRTLMQPNLLIRIVRSFARSCTTDLEVFLIRNLVILLSFLSTSMLATQDPGCHLEPNPSGGVVKRVRRLG